VLAVIQPPFQQVDQGLSFVCNKSAILDLYHVPSWLQEVVSVSLAKAPPLSPGGGAYFLPDYLNSCGSANTGPLLIWLYC